MVNHETDKLEAKRKLKNSRTPGKFKLISDKFE